MESAPSDSPAPSSRPPRRSSSSPPLSSRHRPLQEWDDTPLEDYDEGPPPPPRRRRKVLEEESEEEEFGPPTWKHQVRKGFDQSLPMLVFAAVCLFLAADFWGTPTRIGAHLYPLYLMFLMIGAVAATGGTVAVFVPEEEEAPEDEGAPRSTEQYVVVPRDKWRSMQGELYDLKTLVNSVMPEDLVSAAITPRSAGEATEEGTEGTSRVKSQVDSLSARSLALDLGTISGPIGSDYGETDEEPELSETSVLPAPAPISSPPVEGATVSSEVDALRAASVTGVERDPSENAEAYIKRATLGFANSKSPPLPVETTLAVCNSVLEAYRRLNSLQMREFSERIRDDLRKFVEVTKIPLNPGEGISEYMSRVQSVLEAVSKSHIESESPPKEVASLQWALSLFRGFLESYLNKQEVEEVVEDVERQAVEQMVDTMEKQATTPGARPPNLDARQELRMYAELVKNSLKPLAGKVIGHLEMQSLAKEIDNFVAKTYPPPALAGAPSAPLPSPAAAAVNRLEVKQAKQQLEGRFSQIPGINVGGVTPTLALQVERAEAARPSYFPPPPPPAPIKVDLPPPVPRPMPAPVVAPASLPPGPTAPPTAVAQPPPSLAAQPWMREIMNQSSRTTPSADAPRLVPPAAPPRPVAPAPSPPTAATAPPLPAPVAPATGTLSASFLPKIIPSPSAPVLPATTPPPSSPPALPPSGKSVASVPPPPLAPSASGPTLLPPPKVSVSAPPGPKNPVEQEIEAFYAAISSGAVRESDEEAGSFVQRARMHPPPDESPASVTARAYAGAASLAQAHRRLSESQALSLFASVGPEAERILAKAGTPRQPGEPTSEYVLRVLHSRIAPRAAPPPLPGALPPPDPGFGGLKWSLALFRGVLETYIGPRRADAVVAEAEREATKSPKNKAPANGEELVVYASLVKNALRSLPPGMIGPEEIARMNMALDQFVEDMGGGSTGSGTKRSKENAKQAKDQVDQLFQTILGGKSP